MCIESHFRESNIGGVRPWHLDIWRLGCRNKASFLSDSIEMPVRAHPQNINSEAYL